MVLEETALPTEPQPPPLAIRKIQSNVKTNQGMNKQEHQTKKLGQRHKRTKID